ncbi:hypothetical protein QCA50_009380 [Cerrena zonata]|uniref:Leukotriene A(4) hydrolase n=1 Tax=Cerrena zonata TaxID=2478898 RepID=A0AAW0G173_9APHY
MKWETAKRPSLGSSELDPSTQSNYSNFRVVNTGLDLKIEFSEKKVLGFVNFELENLSSSDRIVLDTSYLEIFEVSVNKTPVSYELVSRVEPLGSALVVPLKSNDSKKLHLQIKYSTTAKCTALQFIEASTGPYLFSQCQAIHARSLYPCFDTPAIKSTFDMKVSSPYPTLMSGRPQEKYADDKDVYYFSQPIPIPSYLVALASGDIEKLPIGPRSDVYSEKFNLKDCQWEFEKDMETFIQIAEDLIFDYEWLKFDALVLPPSFPYGGMENPNITFATPTLISKDRLQVKVMAHELAHSWLGNLVTNCSWEHFWLNEGWTVYLERRILGALSTKEALSKGMTQENATKYGEQVRNFAAIIGWSGLVDTVKTLKPEFTSLVWNLKDKIDPDDAFSRIPYEKGFNFLFFLEKTLGLEDFNDFIKYYFAKFKYQSLDSYQFIDTLHDFFSKRNKDEILDSINWEAWLFSEGLPPVTPQFDTTLADECYQLAESWFKFAKSGAKLPELENSVISHYEPNQHALFLDTLNNQLSTLENISTDFISNFIETYPFYAEVTNGEIKASWNALVIHHGKLTPENPIVTNFADWLGTVGRMKFVRPGYILLKKVNKDYAIKVFKVHQAKYHPICRSMVQKDLDLV